MFSVYMPRTDRISRIIRGTRMIMLETRILKARVESLYMFRSLFSIAYPLCRSSSPVLLSLYWVGVMPVTFLNM